MKPCLVFFKCVLYALVSLSLFIACTDNVSLKTEWQEAKEEKLLSDFVDKHSDLLETFFVKYSLAERLPMGFPLSITCEFLSSVGLRSTGFISVCGGKQHASAWTTCARPISPPSMVE